MITDLGRYVEEWGLEWRADRRIQNLPPAIEQKRVSEFDVLALQSEIKTNVRLPIHVQRDLRHPRVRWNYGSQRVLQSLETLDAGIQVPPVSVIKQIAFPIQIGLRRGGDLVAQVREVGVVGDALQIQHAGKTVSEILLVLPGIAIARLIFLPVIGQVVATHLALGVGLQIAEICVHQHAALGQQARRNRRIAIRRDVPVERLGVFEAALSRAAEGRRQQSGLATTAQREIQIG